MAFWDRFNRLLAVDADRPDPQERIRHAAAVLLVEIARADYQDDPAEAAAVERALASHFGLSVTDAAELSAVARQERETAASFDEHLRTINAELGRTEKRSLLEFLWRVAYADGELHRYEEHLLRRICELLNLSHADFIQTKLAVHSSSV